MKLKLLAICILAMFILAGCKGSGSAGAGSIFAGGSSYYNTGGGDSGDPGPVNPEPATTVLLGGGFAAFAFLKRKRKK